MSITGARVTFAFNVEESPPERVIEIEDIGFPSLTLPKEHELVLRWAVDGNDGRCVDIKNESGIWKARGAVKIKEEFSVVEFTLLSDGNVLGTAGVSGEDLVSGDQHLSITLNEETAIKLTGNIKQYEMVPTELVNEHGTFSRLTTQPEISKALTSQQILFQSKPDHTYEKVTSGINIGLLSLDLFHITNSLRAIESSVSAFQDSLQLARRYHGSSKGVIEQILGLLFNVLQERYNIFAKEKDFEEMIKIQEELLLSLNGDQNPKAILVLANTASSYLIHFQHSMDLSDIDKAIGLFIEAISHPKATGSTRIPLLGNLSNCYRQKYWLSKHAEDIEKSIQYGHETLDIIPTSDPNRPIMMSNLAGSHILRYRETGDIADFNQALEIRTEALKNVPETHSFYPDIICNIANSYLRKFEHTKALEDIDEAISLSTLGVNHTPEGDAIKPRRITDLGNLYLARAESTENPEDADKAIANYRRALYLTPEGHPEASMRTEQLINALQNCFQWLDDPRDIDEAIQLQTERVEEAKPNVRAVELHGLSTLLYRRFSKTNNEADIREAVKVQREAFEVTNSSDKNYSYITKQLRSLLYSLAEHTKNLQDIDDMLEFGGMTLRLIPDTEPTGTSGLAGMSTAYLLRFHSTGALEDIDRAIANQREILRLSTDAVHLKYFGRFLLGRYRLTKDIEDIDEAIDVLQDAFKITSSTISELLRNLREIAKIFMDNYYEGGDTYEFDYGMTMLEEALRRCPPDNDNLPAILGAIGTAHLARFESGGIISDINNAISALVEALEQTPPAHPGLYGRLNDAGKALRVRFENTGDRTDLDRSITMLQQALEKAPHDSAPTTAMCLSDLGSSLLRLFLLDGDAGALEEAVRLLREAVDLSKSDYSHHMHLSHLGNCLLRRYELTGNFADIDEAVSVQQAAVKATVNRHVPLRINLLNLGNAYYSRSVARESVEDMKEAIATFRKARGLVQNESGKMKPAILDNLSGALGDLFDSVKDPDLLEEAIDILTESMALTEANHPYKPIQLNNLAILHRRRYQFTGALEDIEEMIAILNDALEHPARTALTETTANQNLTWATITRFKRTNNIRDLDVTIFHHERSLEKMPETHYSYNNSLTSLAAALETRYRRLDTVADLNKAIQIYQQVALNDRSGLTSQRLTAATSWARALMSSNEPDALDGYGLAIELLPTVAWLGETVSERHNKLSSWSSLVNEAAAAAITWNRLELAIQWLEEGRSIVWNQLNTFRTPVDDLQDVRPDLADELRHISKELDKLGSRGMKEADRMTLNQKSNVQAEARMQRDLAAQWEDTLRNVRTLDGFEDFLRPAKVSKLLKMKRPNGTVVMINVDRTCCDALALRHDSQEIIHIPLSDLTYTKAEALRRLLVSSLTEHGIRSRGTRSGRPSHAPKQNVPFENILNQLWNLVVLPIVTDLGFQPTNSHPRIWWCATGPLAFPPIHAAGIYSGDRAHFGSILSDYVVSSYTPTLNSIFSSVQRNATGVLEKLLIVTQPETPGMLPLPQTVEEGTLVQKKLHSVGHAVEYLESMKATVGNVVKSMETSSWIHLACHAIQDPKNPTKSAFYFYDGTLELSTLIGKQLPNADFAFLSACETGTGDEKLPEEAVHLAAGVLQAGYRSVVATMWAIDDNYAPMVAESVYAHLLERSDPPNSANAAYALQEAAKEVREKMGYSDTAFLTWVPFIHFGV